MAMTATSNLFAGLRDAKTFECGTTEAKERARVLKQQWLERWPEMRLFFKHVGDLVDVPAPVEQDGK
jgi:hypothetical protein